MKTTYIRDRSKSLKKEKRERKFKQKNESTLIEGVDTPLRDGFNPQSRMCTRSKLTDEETNGEALDQVTPMRPKRERSNKKNKEEKDDIKFYKKAIKLFEKQKTNVTFEQVAEALK
jgi:NACalpha-BTF3-like transcription factor